MSTASTFHKFVVYAPDYTAEGTFAQRMAVRETHLANAKAAMASGFIKVGGAMLTPESLEGADTKLVGSVLICEAESLEAVKKFVEGDIYYTGGVWDKEKVVILPFKAATAFP